MEGRGIRTAIVLGGLFALLALTPAAHATFPGDRGKIAFHSNRAGNFEIYVMNADGSSQTRLTTAAGSDVSPVWSADGTKIVFTSSRDGNEEIYSMNANGSGQTRLTNHSSSDITPSWSPDGTKIFFATNRDGNYEVYSMNANGTTPTRITNNAALDAQPVMSPAGDKIAFLTNRDGNFEIYLMNPNGSSPQNVIQRPSGSDSEPNWSPRYRQLIFEASTSGTDSNIYTTFTNFVGCCIDIGFGGQIDTGPAFPPNTGSDFQFAIASTRYDANPLTCSPCNYEISLHGIGSSSEERLTNNSAVDQSPDWQPVVKQYARPQSAPVRRISLVPAFQECTSANANSVPKSIPNQSSCVTPQPTSSYLTIGSPEANGVPANANGFMRLKVFCNGGAPNEGPPCSTTSGDQLDAQVTVTQTDVRCQGTSGSCPSGALSDYVGNVLLELTYRPTDRTSGGFGAGTITDQTVRIPVLCTATGTGNVGSTCSVTTSLDAAIGATTAITEGKRSIWEIRSTRVYDGGADGVATTLGDNTVFLADGLFFP